MEPLTRTLPTQKIHPSNTALLIIDMERDFIDVGAVRETPGGWELVQIINSSGVCLYCIEREE